MDPMGEGKGKMTNPNSQVHHIDAGGQWVMNAAARSSSHPGVKWESGEWDK